MLEELYIKNFALIDELNLIFKSGFNVITGEPGSGKSLVVKALELIRGSRTDVSQIRAGEDYLFVSGRFYYNNEEFVLEREIFADGRSRAKINGKPATLASLKELGCDLIEIHGQHENQRLLISSYQRMLFDTFANLKYDVNRLEQLLRQYETLHSDLQRLEEKLQSARQLQELRDFQIKELKEANVKKGEKAELVELERLLSHQGEVLALTGEIVEALKEKDGCVIDELTRIVKLMTSLAKLKKDFEPLAREFEDLLIKLKELVYPIEEFLLDFDFSPERLNEVRIRLGRIYELETKYRIDADQFENYLENLLKSKSEETKLAEEIEKIKLEMESLRKEINELAESISKRREEKARVLERDFIIAAKSLGFEGVNFVVSITRKIDENSNFVYGGIPCHIYPWGFENIEFIVSLNPNENPYPLEKVASGGELSRIALLLREFLTEADYSPTLVFDEVDSGIGGRIGNLVAEKLRNLSKRHQTIVITHLPQIASLADHHIALEKFKRGSRMIINGRILLEHERVKELARMMGDEKYAAEIAKKLLNEKE